MPAAVPAYNDTEAIVPADVQKAAMVRHPVQGDHPKADEIPEVLGPESQHPPSEIGSRLSAAQPDLQDQQRDGDRHHGIARIIL
jgi:hypothetical protein